MKIEYCMRCYYILIKIKLEVVRINYLWSLVKDKLLGDMNFF